MLHSNLNISFKLFLIYSPATEKEGEGSGDDEDGKIILMPA